MRRRRRGKARKNPGNWYDKWALSLGVAAVAYAAASTVLKPAPTGNVPADSVAALDSRRTAGAIALGAGAAARLWLNTP